MRDKREYWVRIDPNGHIVRAVTVSSSGGILRNAHQKFTPLAVARRSEDAEGWRHEMVTLRQWMERALPCLMFECVHILPFAEAYVGRLKVYGGRAVHATRSGPKGTFTACFWIAGERDKPQPADTDVTCRACIRETDRGNR